MTLAKRTIAAAVACLVSIASAHGADKPNDGKGPENPGRVAKPGEVKDPPPKDAARDNPNKAGERGVRNPVRSSD